MKFGVAWARMSWAFLCSASLIASIARSQQTVDHAGSAVEWIRHAARPFETCEPRAKDSDLAALRQIVGSARVVALGEGTVGTREFVELKHRIVQYFAGESGFTTVAIAANMPETRALDVYIQGGRGDPRALLSGLKYWPYETEEMLAFVEWMRAFNAAHPGRLQLVGLNMSKPDVPADSVRVFLRRVDPEWADSLTALGSAISMARQAVAQSVVVRGEFPAAVAAGHHVRFSGWICTQDVSDYAGLWWRADAQGGRVAFDNMEQQRVKGTSGWRHYATELDLPANADHIVFGALMSGTGRAWFDSLGIEIDGKVWSRPSELDLSLESAGEPTGLRLVAGPGYEIRMDDSTAAVGRRSLRLSSVEGFVRPDASSLWTAAEERAARVVSRFESQDQPYRRASCDAEVVWMARYAHLLLQRTRMSLREGAQDSSLAANLEWVMGRLPKESKVVVWALDDQVTRASGSMGARLAKHFGRDMVVVGFATNEGRCTTTRTTSAHLEATELQPGPAGSFEALAVASRAPSQFLLDLRRVPAGSPAAAGLSGQLTLRSIGTLTPVQEFWPVALLRDYDVIAWVEKTHATRPLTTP
jgi:erythromycin esterase-like protein